MMREWWVGEKMQETDSLPMRLAQTWWCGNKQITCHTTCLLKDLVLTLHSCLASRANSNL